LAPKWDNTNKTNNIGAIFTNSFLFLIYIS
jgi:hypothetical protein